MSERTITDDEATAGLVRLAPKLRRAATKLQGTLRGYLRPLEGRGLVEYHQADGWHLTPAGERAYAVATGATLPLKV